MDFPTKEEYEYTLENALFLIEAKINVLQKEATSIRNELSTCKEEKISEQNNQETLYEI